MYEYVLVPRVVKRFICFDRLCLIVCGRAQETVPVAESDSASVDELVEVVLRLADVAELLERMFG